MSVEKNLMVEAAILYYEKKYTQQEIAKLLKLSRQTVSKLLNDAIAEHVVEIKIHHPEMECRDLEQALCTQFGIRHAAVCNVSAKDSSIRQLMTVKKAAEYLLPFLQKGKQNIAVSWGRTLHALIEELPQIHTKENIVFPLFGATDTEKSCFLSNELARGFADKIGADVKYAWFPYRPDKEADCELLKRTSYYKKINDLWSKIDIAIVGIGNTAILQLFEDTFGYHEKNGCAVGDIATHFFSSDGTLITPNKHVLCVSSENLKNTKQTIAIAYSDDENDKDDAIIGALRTGLIDTLVTDKYTAQSVLAKKDIV